MNIWQRYSAIVILNKRSLRREGSGRAARSVAFFATQQSRVWLASLSNCTSPELTTNGALDIQILNIQRILLNKLPPRLHILAHQRARKIRAGQTPKAAPNVFSLN